jgi:hypothetical protein
LLLLVLRHSQDDYCHLPFPNTVIFLEPAASAFAGRIF